MIDSNDPYGEVRQHVIDKTREAADGLGIPDHDRAMVEAMSHVVVLMARYYEAVSTQEPEDVAEVAKSIYLFREAINRQFPVPSDCREPLFGFCMECDNVTPAPTTCAHHDHQRIAMFAMALLRYYPEPDLDLAHEEGDEP